MDLSIPLSQDKLNEIEDTIDGIINEGKINQKAIDYQKSLKRKQDRAIVFEGLAKRNKRKSVELNNISEVSEYFDSIGEKVVVIDGHLIESKAQALELMEKNPWLEIKGSKGYDKATIKNIDYSKSKAKHVKERLNPLSAARNTFSLFAKVYFGAGEEIKPFIKEKFIDAIPKARFDKMNATMDKTRFVNDSINKIFGSERKAKKALLDKPTVDVNKSISNEGGEIVNDHVVDYYNIAQMDGYTERLMKSGVDVEAVNDYINSNPKLKEYADFLMDYYNGELKAEYEGTYISILNKPFFEGIYYPTSALKQLETVVDTQALFTGEKDGGQALINAVSGNLKDKTGFKGAINTNETAKEKLLKYIEGMEHSKAYIPIAEDFNNMMRPSVQAELFKSMGKDAFIELLESMQIILTKQNPYQKNTSINRVVNGVATWGVLGTLGLKLGSVPKQAIAFTNLIGAGLEDGINIVNWMDGMAIRKSSEFDAVKKFLSSNWIEERFKQGGIDMETRRVFNDMKKSVANKVVGKVMDVGMLPVKAGDLASVVFGSVPLFTAYYRKGINKGMTVEDAYEYAYFNASEKSERVLQSSYEDITSLGQKTQLGRLLYTFKSAQVAMMTKMVDAVRKLRSGQKLSKDEVYQALWDAMYFPVANASFVAISSKAIMTMLFDNDDMSEEDKDKAMAELGLGIASSDLQGFGASGLIADQLLNSFIGDQWKNKLPIARFGESLTTGGSSLGFLMLGGNWDSLTDKEKNSIASLGAMRNLIEAKEDWTKVKEGEMYWLDAVMNWNEYKDDTQKSLYDRWLEDTGSDSSVLQKSSSGGSRSTSRSGSRSESRQLSR